MGGKEKFMGQKVEATQKGLIFIKGLFISYVVTAIMLFILALILYKAKPPEGVIGVGIILTYIISAFVGGLIVGKSAVKKRFIWGMLLGILYFLIIIIVSLILNKDIMSHLGSMIMVFFMCGLGGMLGGMVS